MLIEDPQVHFGAFSVQFPRVRFCDMGNVAIIGDPELASNYRVSDYSTDEAASNRNGIADAIHRRFKERYVDPTSPNVVHGFTKMAIASLMIEALVSFRRGWPDTRDRGKGELAFCSFFATHPEFASFVPHGRDFYTGIRCGILHQAETTLGWRIRFDTATMLEETAGVRTINSRMFIAALGRALDRYRDDLKAAPWDDDLWKDLRKKMRSVIQNCQP